MKTEQENKTDHIPVLTLTAVYELAYDDHYNESSGVIRLNVFVWMKQNHILLPQPYEHTSEANLIGWQWFFLHEAS